MKKEIKMVFAMILTVMLVIILLPGAGALGKVNADEINRISEFEIISDWDFEDAIYEGAIPSAESMNLRFNKNKQSLSDDSGWIADCMGIWYKAGNDNVATSFIAGEKYYYEIVLTAKSGAAFQAWFDYESNNQDSYTYLVNGDECHNDGSEWQITYNDSVGSKISLVSKVYTVRPSGTPNPTPALSPTTAPQPSPTPASKLPVGAEKAELVGHESRLKYPKYSDTPTFFKFVLSAASDIEIRQAVSDKDEYKLYDADGKLVASFTEQDLDSKRNKKVEGLAPGTYYLGIRGTNKNNAGSYVGDQLLIYAVESNRDAGNAKTIELSDKDGSVSVEFQQARVNGKMNNYYYKLVVKEKTWYSFKDSSNVTGCLYKGDKESGDSLLTTSELNSNNNGELLLDKGTYLLVVYGAKEGGNYKVVINSRDFKDIKKINCKDTYEVYQGTTKITLSYEPADFESKVKWSEGNDVFSVSAYDYNEKTNLEPTEAIIYANALGEYTSTITTSEGVSKTIKVNVVPRPTKVSYAEAVTKSKKKATIKLEWSGDANWYKIYQKSSKDKDFKVVKETGDSKVTLTTKPNLKLTYKIESCYKKDGKIISSSMGEGVGAMTAPYKAPTLKSAKQKGGTKYIKPYKKSIWHPATKSRVGHYETVKLGNQSNANVKIKIKKVSGAKYYEANKGNTNAVSQGTNVINFFKNKLSFTYKGKISGKTEKVKVRGVWKKGVGTAYGPWSKTKKVKIKGNK